MNLIKNFTIKGIVHITGGGFMDNIPRIVPSPCQVVITQGSWTIPPIFEVIQKQGHIADDEMRRVFNMGIGMILVVPEKEAQEILERIEKLGELAYLIGVISQRENNQPSVVFV
jgi:phosphoribosylformylglycinamidine cyclo-ligase